jgi:hypothetical protein
MTQSHFGSRSNPNVELNDETYSTIDLYLGSQNGSTGLAGYVNQNAGFTCLLANPIILDISHRYVIALVKKSFDVSQYTSTYRNFSIYCDLLEYQYEFGQKTQLLYQSYDHRYTPTSSNLQDMNPATTNIINVAWKFINPTTKIIDRISFWVLDDAGLPLNTPQYPSTVVPPVFSYPTNFNVLIKKVNSHVIAVSAL